MDKIIIANWKANPAMSDEALELFDFYVGEISKYQNINLVVCPPFVYLEELAKRVQGTGSRVQLGVQDTFWEKSGPYTGEISVDMLHPVKSSKAGAKQFDRVKNFRVSHVLVGHSDRRYKIGLPSTTLGGSKVVLGESDEVINKKIKVALESEIIPVLLVGERNRSDNRQAVLEQQLSADLAGLTAEQISKTLITYEPVWAISTQPDAQPDTPENTLEAMKIIRDILGSKLQTPNSKFLYGGSVNQNNVAGFLGHPEISGAVIGGASLRKEEFAEILQITAMLDIEN